MKEADAPGDVAATSSHLVVTVHGIRTFGHWQERLERVFLAEQRTESQTEFIHYKYGYLSIIGFMMPFFVRWLVVRRFRRALISLCANRAWRRIDLVAHSFGTYIVAHAIRTLPAENRSRFHTLILSGSVLHSSFPWSAIIGSRVGRVVNDCGTRDFVLLLAQLFILRMGAAGWTGFVGATGRAFRNRYSNFGHSGYFVNSLGKPDDHYMKEHWLPLLISDEPIALFDKRIPSVGQGLLQFFGNNADPIKLALYISPFVALSILGLNMYFSALASETQLIARIAAERTANGDFDSAMPMLLEVVRDERLKLSEKNRLRPYSEEATAVLYNSTINFRGTRLLPGLTGNVLWTEFTTDGEHLLAASIDEIRYWSLSPNPTSKEIPYKSYATIGPIIDVGLSPNGKRIAVLPLVGPVTLWDPESAVLVDAIPISGGRLRFSPDSKQLAVTSGAGGSILIRNLEKNTTTEVQLPEEVPIRCLAFSYSGRYLAAGSNDGRIYLIEVENSAKITQLKGTGAQTWLTFSQGDEVIAASSDDGSISFWDVTTREGLARFALSKQSIDQIDIRVDGNQIVTASSDGYVRFSTLGASLYRIPEDEDRHTGRVLSVKYSQDGRIALSVAADGSARLWNTYTGQPFEDAHRLPYIYSASLSRDGRKIALGGQTGYLAIRSVSPAGLDKTLHGHKDSIEALGFSPDGSRIVGAVSDGTVRVWDVPSGSELPPVDSPKDEPRPNAVSYSPDGKKILVSYDSGARLFDAEDGKLLKEFDRQSGDFPARFSPDGKLILVVHSGVLNSLQLWQAPYEQPSHQWIDIFGSLKAVAFSTESLSVAFSDNKEMFDWDVGGGDEKRLSFVNSENIVRLSFAKNPNQIITVSLNGDLRFWSKDQRWSVRDFKGVLEHSGPVLALPARNLIAAGRTHGSVALLDVERGNVVVDLRGHRSEITHLMVTRDERLLFSASKDGSIKAWDLGSLSLVAAMPGQGSEIMGMVLSPNERLLAAAGSDGTVRLWHVYASGQAVVDGARRLSNGYSPEPRSAPRYTARLR